MRGYFHLLGYGVGRGIEVAPTRVDHKAPDSRDELAARACRQLHVEIAAGAHAKRLDACHDRAAQHSFEVHEVQVRVVFLVFLVFLGVVSSHM